MPTGTENHGFKDLFAPDYIKATIFVSVFWVCNVTPYFAIGSFAPTVLQQLGLGDGMAGGLALNAIALLGTVVVALLIERVGRRRLGIPPFFISTVALILLAFYSDQSVTLVVACVLVFAFVNAVSTTLTGVYPGEVFPTE
ncbi:MFS transporter, partial [Paracoccus sp. PXZ]